VIARMKPGIVLDYPGQRRKGERPVMNLLFLTAKTWTRR